MVDQSGRDGGELFEWAPGLMLPRPRHGNALSPEKAKRLLQLDAEGLPRVDICERLGVHNNTVTKYLRIAGRPLVMTGRRAANLAATRTREQGATDSLGQRVKKI